MPPHAPLALSIIVALWLAIAIVATWLARRRAVAAGRALEDVQLLSGLISASPSVPMLVHADGHIDADPRIADWLGYPPDRLSDLAADTGGAGARLHAAISATFSTGASLSDLLVLDTTAVLEVQGGPYVSPALSGRAVLVWFTDATPREQRIEQLTQETERLSRSLESLSTLIEAAPFPMWHRAPDLALALVNQAYVRAVEGKDASDVVRRGLELIEPNGDGTPGAIAGQARDHGGVSSRLAPAIAAGERRVMRVVDVPIGDIGVAGFAMDVQELQDARADLERFGEAQRDMLDRLSAGVAQFGGDHSLVFYNRHFLRLFGLDPEWLSDRPDFDRVLERMRETQRAPESRDFPNWKAERRAWFLSTEAVEENWLVPGGIHLRVVAQPLPDGGLLLIFEDRTEHLQLASARDTLLRVRTATFDNLFEAVGVFAADGRLHLWNNRFREVWGLEEAELSRHPRVDALVQSVAPKLADPTRAGMIRELVRVATLERQQRSGRIAMKDGRHFEFAAVPLPDGNALFALLDITASRGIEEALRDRNEALEEANSIKNAFVASMSYELRVPLTSIAGFAEMLASGYAGPLDPTATEYVEAIMAAVARLGALIGDVLDLSQSEAGSLPMATDPIDLTPLLREAAQVAADDAASKGLVLALDISPCGSVDGDRRRLRQCFDHIIGNAVNYTPGGGRVLVRARCDDEWAEILVSDNGNGIPANLRARIFDRLGRVRLAVSPSEVDTRRRHGGLGLPLARQFVEAHGGTLVLDSEVGRGTNAIIRLPLRKPDAG